MSLTFLSITLIFIILTTRSISCLETKVPLEDCGSPLAELQRLEIVPECAADTCFVKSGERITVIADMIPKINTKQLFVTGYQKDPYWGFESYLWKENLCSSRFNITCPLKENEVVNVYFSELMPANIPPAKFRLKMIVTGDEDKQILCKSAIVTFK